MKKIIPSLSFIFLFSINLNAHDCRCVDIGVISTIYEWYAESEDDCCDGWTGYGTYTDYIGGTQLMSGYASSSEILDACC